MSKLLTMCIVAVMCVSSLGGGGHPPVSGHLEGSQSHAYLETLEALHRRGAGFSFLPEWQLSELLELLMWLQRGVGFGGDWTSPGLRTAMRGLRMTLAAFDGDLERFTALLGLSMHQPLILSVCSACYTNDSHVIVPARNQITFDSNPDLTSFLHETGHLVDYYLAQLLETGSTWWSERGLVGLGWFRQAHQSGEARLYYVDDEHDAPHSKYSPREDFADTFTAWVLARNGASLPRGWRLPSHRRLTLLATVLST